MKTGASLRELKSSWSHLNRPNIFTHTHNDLCRTSTQTYSSKIQTKCLFFLVLVQNNSDKLASIGLHKNVKQQKLTFTFFLAALAGTFTKNCYPNSTLTAKNEWCLQFDNEFCTSIKHKRLYFWDYIDEKMGWDLSMLVTQRGLSFALSLTEEHKDRPGQLK